MRINFMVATTATEEKQLTHDVVRGPCVLILGQKRLYRQHEISCHAPCYQKIPILVHTFVNGSFKFPGSPTSSSFFDGPGTSRNSPSSFSSIVHTTLVAESLE